MTNERAELLPGDRVRKVQGYPFGNGDAVVLAAYRCAEGTGPMRYVVEHPEGWQHIFNRQQLELVSRPALAAALTPDAPREGGELSDRANQVAEAAYDAVVDQMDWRSKYFSPRAFRVAYAAAIATDSLLHTTPAPLSDGALRALAGLELTEDGYSLRTPFDGDVDGDGRHVVVGGEIVRTFADSDQGEELRDAILAALSTSMSDEPMEAMARWQEISWQKGYADLEKRSDTLQAAVIERALRPSPAPIVPGEMVLVPRVRVEAIIAELECPSDGNIVGDALSQRICCNGVDCGCYGASVGSYLAHHIRQDLLSAASSPDADADGVRPA